MEAKDDCDADQKQSASSYKVKLAAAASGSKLRHLNHFARASDWCLSALRWFGLLAHH